MGKRQHPAPQVPAAYRMVRYVHADAGISEGLPAAGGPGAATPPHSLEWLKTTTTGQAWWLSVQSPEGRPVTGFSVDVVPTRALPGHRFLRLEHLRFPPDSGPAEAAVQYLVDLAERDGRTLSVSVDSFFADGAEAARAESVLEAAGFGVASQPRMYTHTVRIDLTGTPDEILAGFHSTARRHIRAVAKRPVEIRQVKDPALAGRLSAILHQSFRRTEGREKPEPWAALISFCDAHPDQARLVSLVRVDQQGGDAVVAFALGLNRGDHVEYATAGSTRPPDLKMPLGYALAWDLMLWARSVGAGWFDFGGIATEATSSDQRAGIYDFKRMFSSDVVRVRQEWSYVVRPVRHAWAGAVSRLAERARVAVGAGFSAGKRAQPGS